MDSQSNEIHSTTDSANFNYSSTLNSVADKGKAEIKKTQQQAENIVVKAKKVAKQQWDQTCRSLGQVQQRVSKMVPKQCLNLIYWQNPIQSGIVFGVLLSAIITFMCLSSLAAIAFWLLAFLVVVGLYKLYNYIMVTFLGRVQDDIFESMFPSDISISSRQAQDLADYIRVNGTSLLKHARELFLWQNLTNSALFGCVLFIHFYIGLSMNSLTIALIGLIFIFTVPKIYQVYQVPIDRTAKKVFDQINQLLAKVTSKLPNKSKSA